jgi:hypothetical protein
MSSVYESCIRRLGSAAAGGAGCSGAGGWTLEDELRRASDQRMGLRMGITLGTRRDETSVRGTRGTCANIPMICRIGFLPWRTVFSLDAREKGRETH